MTDRYENIRAALAMGPTPGPWELKDGRTDTIENAQGYPVCTVHYHPYELYGHGVRAAYIAACDPDTIRALLDERDALREALAKAEGIRDAAQFAARNGDSLSRDAIHAVREMLKGAGVPTAAFIDDHVGNAIVQRDQERTRAEAAEARVAELEKALGRLLASPALADENHSDPEWGCEETAIAVTAARRALEARGVAE